VDGDEIGNRGSDGHQINTETPRQIGTQTGHIFRWPLRRLRCRLRRSATDERCLSAELCEGNSKIGGGSSLPSRGRAW